MADPYDLLAKDVIELLLEDAGRVQREAEVALPAQFIDTAFAPSSAGRTLLRRRGLLGRMAMVLCAFEFFHGRPTPGNLRDLVRKHLAWHHTLTLRARKDNRNATVPLPTLYVVCARAPRRLLRACQATPSTGWPTGFYDVLSSVIGVRMVVVDELPASSRATLPLRLCGRDKVLDEALKELAALKRDAWERRAAEAVVQFALRRGTKETSMARVSEELKDFKEQLRNEGRSEGRNEGRNEGRFEGLALVAARKLARPLTAVERDGLRRHIAAAGPERAGDAIVDLDATALAAWLSAS